MDARAGNDRLAEQAGRLHFVSRVPMLCECSDPGCRTVVMIDLGEYHEVRRDPANVITAPGHEVAGSELRREEPDYEIRRASRGRDEGNGDRRSA